MHAGVVQTADDGVTFTMARPWPCPSGGFHPGHSRFCTVAGEGPPLNRDAIDLQEMYQYMREGYSVQGWSEAETADLRAKAVMVCQVGGH